MTTIQIGWGWIATQKATNQTCFAWVKTPAPIHQPAQTRPIVSDPFILAPPIPFQPPLWLPPSSFSFHQQPSSSTYSHEDEGFFLWAQRPHHRKPSLLLGRQESPQSRFQSVFVSAHRCAGYFASRTWTNINYSYLTINWWFKQITAVVDGGVDKLLCEIWRPPWRFRYGNRQIDGRTGISLPEHEKQASIRFIWYNSLVVSK